MVIAFRIPTETTPPPAGVRDLEFDAPGGSEAQPRIVAVSLHRYQRIVANPFLAALGVVLWVAALRFSRQVQRVELLLAALGSGFLLPFLLQYHCLDCGKAGRVWRAAAHSCVHVQARIQSGKPRRFRGPSAVTQTKLWLLVMGTAGVLAWLAQ